MNETELNVLKERLSTMAKRKGGIAEIKIVDDGIWYRGIPDGFNIIGRYLTALEGYKIKPKQKRGRKLGHLQSEKTKIKIRNTKLGILPSKETKAKMRRSMVIYRWRENNNLVGVELNESQVVELDMYLLMRENNLK